MIPDALLERYLANDLPTALRAELEATLQRSDIDRARLADLRADSAAFLLQHPPGPVVDRLTSQRRRRWLFSLLAVPAAALAALVLVPSREEATTIKGGVSLVVYAKRGAVTVRLGPEDHLAAGDQIRFQVTAPAAGFVAVIGRDSTGAVTVYAPFGASAAKRYDPRDPLLPDAIELDAAGVSEDLYAIISSAPFSLAAATAALRGGQPLEQALPGVAVGHVRLVKNTNPR